MNKKYLSCDYLGIYSENNICLSDAVLHDYLEGPLFLLFSAIRPLKFAFYLSMKEVFTKLLYAFHRFLCVVSKSYFWTIHKDQKGYSND